MELKQKEDGTRQQYAYRTNNKNIEKCFSISQRGAWSQWANSRKLSWYYEQWRRGGRSVQFKEKNKNRKEKTRRIIFSQCHYLSGSKPGLESMKCKTDNDNEKVKVEQYAQQSEESESPEENQMQNTQYVDSWIEWISTMKR